MKPSPETRSLSSPRPPSGSAGSPAAAFCPDVRGDFEVPGPDSQQPFPQRSCQISQFKSLSPRELETFKVAKDAYVSSWRAFVLHSSSPSQRLSSLPSQVSVRPVVLQAELKLTLEVLKAVTKPELDSVLAQPLQTLSHIHQEIQSCVTSQTSKEHRLPGRLKNWLNKLSEARKEPQNCLEASIMLNLFRLLTQDLRCVAYGDLC
uniref:Uncharacterized protein n=1 Tax=Sarcophilus harrisii TaxID=9305 RepID=A0A7N4PCD1_SARHA